MDNETTELFGCDYLERVMIKGKSSLEKCHREILANSKFCDWHTCGKFRRDLDRECTNAKIANVHSCQSCNTHRLKIKTKLLEKKKDETQEEE